MPGKPQAGRRIVRTICLGLVLLGAVLSFLPLVETNAWWVRYLDFVRLQLAVLLAAGLACLLAAGGARSRPGALVAVLGLAGLGYHASQLYPYLWREDPATVAAETCGDGDRMDVMVANVQKSNEHRDPLLALVEAADPDLLLLLETDAWWDEALEPIARRYPFTVQHIPETAEAFGMHLLSRLPLEDPDILFWFGSETPTVRAGVALPSGEAVAFIGLHPRPPLYWGQPSTLRDGHLLRAALEASDSATPTILAGDFNAVPWERVNRRALRIGGLLDPRVGRGLYPTYDTRSWVMSWPLDQILHQDGLALLEFERLPAFGSDHYPIRAALCLSPRLADRQSAPALASGDLAEAEAAIAAARDAR